MVRVTRLRLVRLRKALTQDELAGKAKVSRHTVIRLEAGYAANPPTIRKLAAALDVEPNELMDDFSADRYA